MIFLFVSELYFRIQRSLTSQTSSSLLFRDKFTLDKWLFFLWKFFDLLSLSLVEIFIHLIVRFVSKAFKANKFGAILDISVLFIGSPPDEMIIFKYKRFRTVALLHDNEFTYYTNDPVLYLIFWLALSLKSRWGKRNLRVWEDTLRIFPHFSYSLVASWLRCCTDGYCTSLYFYSLINNYQFILDHYSIQKYQVS